LETFFLPWSISLGIVEWMQRLLAVTQPTVLLPVFAILNLPFLKREERRGI
jgi:hypothetical protein